MILSFNGDKAYALTAVRIYPDLSAHQLKSHLPQFLSEETSQPPISLSDGGDCVLFSVIAFLFIQFKAACFHCNYYYRQLLHFCQFHFLTTPSAPPKLPGTHPPNGDQIVPRHNGEVLPLPLPGSSLCDTVCHAPSHRENPPP